MFIIWSRRLVSTRTVVSAGGAAAAAFLSSFLGAGLAALGFAVEPGLDGAAEFDVGAALTGAACLAF